MCVYLIYVGTIYLAVNEGRNMRNVAGVGREMREIGEGGRSALHTIKYAGRKRHVVSTQYYLLYHTTVLYGNSIYESKHIIHVKKLSTIPTPI